MKKLLKKMLKVLDKYGMIAIFIIMLVALYMAADWALTQSL